MTTTQKSNKQKLGSLVDVIGDSAKKLIRSFNGRRSEFEQHIAIFGESGSGKTTLLTVFYGYQQTIEFQHNAGYSLLADDTTQGQSLLNSFYNLETKPIAPTRLTSREYSFSIRPEGVKKNAGKIVWHDYPGEWWTETKTAEEQEDKEKTFLSLISSDVALFLVDGTKLKNDGDKYLKRLFCNFRDELRRLKEYPALKNSFPLTHFPRIWLICLSKSDLWPDMTAEKFKQKILKIANQELQEVKNEIQAIIEEPELFNLGEDYLLLSAFEYDEKSESITDIKKRKGVDLIAPIAFTVPVKRSLWWAKKKRKAISNIATAVEIIRKLTTGWLKWVPLVGYYFNLLDQIAKKQVIDLIAAKENALKKGAFIDAILIAFEDKLSKYNIEKTFICRDEETIG
ncbi:MAG: 50S ribosome-binding GTPase [Victivallales bacterium]|nr:50S ribosome-binding GTPase [Victivallales bacterium]